ncbi:hypothetical protein NC652_016134 [Populus alba x Populus x berolinensis]|nr:hypothetical protein NC652_016134 [Populus alba x Populus x berolinensis]
MKIAATVTPKCGAAQDYVAWKHISNGDLLSPITPQYNICNDGSCDSIRREIRQELKKFNEVCGLRRENSEVLDI